jgi:hypothetical protein
MIVAITVTGGPYYGASYEGPLAAAPVTLLIPEGIESARTVAEAAQLRDTIERVLREAVAMELASLQWAIRVERRP